MVGIGKTPDGKRGRRTREAGGLVEAIGRYELAMRRRGLTEATIYRVRGALGRVERDIGLWGTEPEAIETWLDAQQFAAKTRYWYLSTLGRFYQWSITQGLTDRDPTAGIVRPRMRRYLPRPAQEPDVDMAIELAEPQMRAWLTLAAFAGLRCAEIATLERHQIQEASEPPLLRIAGKGGVERMVPMHPRVWETLRAYGLPRTGRVFRSSQGSVWRPARVSRLIAVYLDDLGLDLTAHQFRHRFATQTYQRCQDLRAVQELLGHSSPTTTAVYAAWSPSVATSAVMAL